MNFENKFSRFMRNSGPARFFIPVGLILVIFGVFMFSLHTENYDETVGKVTSVVETVNANNEKEQEVSFTYKVDGKEYESVFNGFFSDVKEGDDIKVYYNPRHPESTSNTKMGGIIAPAMIGVGVAALIAGVFMTVKNFKKSKELDAMRIPSVSFEGFKNAPGVTEYYCRHDGNTFKPGYVLEDAARNVLFEGKMAKQAVVGARIFEFYDHTTGSVKEHEVGHTVTQTYNDEYFAVTSWFKFDGENIWNVLHGRGLRMTTNIRSKFPNVIYEVSKDGAPYALLETTGKYVHEDEAAQHKVNIPVGRYYYRVWTNSNDFETLFLTIFGISETEQMMVE